MERPHLFPGKTGQNKEYTYAGQGGGPTLNLPQGVSRVQHGQKLKADIEGGVNGSRRTPLRQQPKQKVQRFNSRVTKD
jgi:hypothetical protein